MFGLAVWDLIKKDTEHCKFKNQEKNKNKILPYVSFKTKTLFMMVTFSPNIIFRKIKKYFKLLVFLRNFNISFPVRIREVVFLTKATIISSYHQIFILKKFLPPMGTLWASQVSCLTLFPAISFLIMREQFWLWLKLTIGKEIAAHSSILAWRIPCTEELGAIVHWVAKGWTWLSD